MSRVASATRSTPMSARPPDRSIRQAAPTRSPPVAGDGGEAFARRQARGDDVLDHERPGRSGAMLKAAPQREDAVLALDEHGLGAEVPRRLVARDDGRRPPARPPRRRGRTAP